MKRNISFSVAIVALILTLSNQVNAQVAINTTGDGPHGSAMLDITSTSKGLLIPRMTEAERDAITNPSSGLLIYQTTNESFYYWDGGTWYKLGSQWVNNGENIYFPNRVVVGGSNGSTSAALDIQSSTGGVLVPRMYEEEKLAIKNPVSGLLIYQIDNTTGFYFYNGDEWLSVGGVRTINVNSPLTYSGGATPTISLATVAVSEGGTGVTTFATNGILFGSGTSPLSSNKSFVRVGDATTNLIGIGTTGPHSTLHINGSIATGFKARTTPYTASATDNCINIIASGTITLPTATTIAGRNYTIKNTSTGNVIVATTNSQTIDGAATYTLSAQYKYVTVISDGSNWLIIGGN
ncbi:hypothetical protein [Williamwhitmania taraxaci]|uniref:Uncharacterized protein n=1 Tax=Williamwhitmania taraxaci TaxID=1640674 RepID=A0A1G6T3H8_9BACT|nr:hypothetical protein [Williamwhitmania taraxaci]SDD23571.1 hypothetical protein SAMN05216323_11112 [Williamwhitmania taraxaci]